MILIKFLLKKKYHNYSFETRRDLELKPGWVEEKTEEEKTRRPGQDLVANPLTFVFFFLLKRRRFNF
jgi:hypothetical protein